MTKNETHFSEYSFFMQSLTTQRALFKNQYECPICSLHPSPSHYNTSYLAAVTVYGKVSHAIQNLIWGTGHQNINKLMLIFNLISNIFNTSIWHLHLLKTCFGRQSKILQITCLWNWCLEKEKKSCGITRSGISEQRNIWPFIISVTNSLLYW